MWFWATLSISITADPLGFSCASVSKKSKKRRKKIEWVAILQTDAPCWWRMGRIVRRVLKLQPLRVISNWFYELDRGAQCPTEAFAVTWCESNRTHLSCGKTGIAWGNHINMEPNPKKYKSMLWWIETVTKKRKALQYLLLYKVPHNVPKESMPLWFLHTTSTRHC